jgi:cytochrome c oxidase cbb3-type subunit III
MNATISGLMTAFGTMLSDTDVKNVASYVISLGGQAGDAGQIAAGKAVFDVQCAACHGPDAKGMTMVGAPNLTDNIWLYGGLRSDIETTIRLGRGGKMPAHAAVLSPQEAKVLAAYVLSL